MFNLIFEFFLNSLYRCYKLMNVKFLLDKIVFIIFKGQTFKHDM